VKANSWHAEQLKVFRQPWHERKTFTFLHRKVFVLEQTGIVFKVNNFRLQAKQNKKTEESERSKPIKAEEDQKFRARCFSNRRPRHRQLFLNKLSNRRHKVCVNINYEGCV
jgi:hypothetical protein